MGQKTASNDDDTTPLKDRFVRCTTVKRKSEPCVKIRDTSDKASYKAALPIILIIANTHLDTSHIHKEQLDKSRYSLSASIHNASRICRKGFNISSRL